MSEWLDQTVDQYLSATSASVLAEKAAESDYWAKCFDFIQENEDKPLRDLSYKQRDWLIKIKEGLLA